MGRIFEWNESEMQAMLGSCRRDEALPLLERHFPKGARLLESGCGAGRWVRFLADHGYRVVGLEYSAGTVAMVRRAWPDLDIVQGDCVRAPFRDGSFDGVLSFGVVEHWIEGPGAPLAELARVLKPGAKAYISVPCFTGVRRLKRALWIDEVTQAPRALAVRVLKGKPKPLARANRAHRYPAFPAWGRFFEYRMSPADFRAEVVKAGLEVVEHVPVGHMDGVYHDLNPLGLLVGWRDWAFHPTPAARWLDRTLAAKPFAHAHMQAIVARRPPRR